LTLVLFTLWPRHEIYVEILFLAEMTEKLAAGETAAWLRGAGWLNTPNGPDELIFLMVPCSKTKIFMVGATMNFILISGSHNEMRP
jgi:hypothetical protein